MPHSLSDLLVHVIFSTKGRLRILDNDLRVRLFGYIAGIVKHRRGLFHVIDGSDDHVHMLVSLPKGLSVVELMRFVKGSSSGWCSGRLIQRVIWTKESSLPTLVKALLEGKDNGSRGIKHLRLALLWTRAASPRGAGNAVFLRR